MDTVKFILSWALCGLIVGFVARLLVPGPHALGILRTIVLGILGAFVGGLICWAMYGPPGEPFSLSTDAWRGWLFSIVGAVILLLLYTWWERRSSRSSWW
jgi:uncharacterized membrane protein YeaQ/YmgE (transglycosylase-associated protein family)